MLAEIIGIGVIVIILASLRRPIVVTRNVYVEKEPTREEAETNRIFSDWTMEIEKEKWLKANKHGHDFDPKEQRCWKCGMGQITYEVDTWENKAQECQGYPDYQI
jgi:hypothetical protein